MQPEKLRGQFWDDKNCKSRLNELFSSRLTRGKMNQIPSQSPSTYLIAL